MEICVFLCYSLFKIKCSTSYQIGDDSIQTSNRVTTFEVNASLEIHERTHEPEDEMYSKSIGSILYPTTYRY